MADTDGPVDQPTMLRNQLTIRVIQEEEPLQRVPVRWLLRIGLVLNRITLWNTVYLDITIKQLRASGYPVLDADVARLSPYLRKHINVHGHYSFQLPELGGGRRVLRDPDAPDEE